MPDPTSPLSVSRLLLQARRAELDTARRLASRAELVAAIGQLVHALQRERGAASGFLASQGTRFAERCTAARAESAPVVARVRERFAALADDPAAGARMLATAAWVLLGIDALAALHERVDRRTVDAHDAVAAYSRLIAGLVELVGHVAEAAPLPGVSRVLVALLHLVQGKEAAGQERAVGALLFASGAGDEAQRQRLLQLIDAQERGLQVFADFADPALRERWLQQQEQPVAARLERLRRVIAAAAPGAALDAALADAWFDACSERIGALGQFEVELVAALRTACDEEIAAAERELHDSETLLQRLRQPAHVEAVGRFFDAASPPPALASAGESASLLGLLQTQAARLATIEAELDAARHALHERKVVERAKGVLMSRLAMAEDEAFRALQKTAMDQNRKLVDVAEATLALPDAVFTQLAAQRAS